MLDCKTINQGYRYEVLLQAINFFTQRFSLEQISQYAFEFTNEILTLNSTALFVREGNQYILKEKRLYDIPCYEIPCSKVLEELPRLHGEIITNEFNLFFDEQTIKMFDMKLAMPLIIDDFLYGFIISNGKILNDFDQDDQIIASTLARLFANALGNSRQLDELGKKNKQLDQKIFNLFAINQSAKSLLLQVNLEQLYTLATDIFSEITCSKVTSFGIYDEISHTIKVLGYRNVCNYSTLFTELHLNNRSYRKTEIVLHFKRDREIIKSIFTNWQEFELLETQYIVLLVKDEILGIVTLSEPVNERIYDESTFELIETLASFTHIAISNALLFRKMLDQSERVKRKFDTLNTLNKVIQNINRGINIDELSSLTLKVLAVNFGVKKAFFAYYNGGNYSILYQEGLAVQHTTFTPNKEWEKALAGELILDFKQNSLNNFFEAHLVSEIGESNCIVIAPICATQVYLEQQSWPKGMLIILETEDSLKEEQIFLIDTITKNISPVIYQMDLNERIKETYCIDPVHEFTAAIEAKLFDKREYDLDFYVFYKILNISPFKKTKELLVEDHECYLVDQFIFIVTYDDEIEDKDFCLAPEFTSIEEVTEFDYIGFYQMHQNN